MPTIEGYKEFLLLNLLWGDTDIPSGWIQISYDLATEQAINWFRGIAPTTYTQCVYNLATHLLIMNAPDDVVDQYRQNNNIGASPTINNSFSDGGTSGSLMDIDAYKNMSISNANYMLTVFGRSYMGMLPIRPPVRAYGCY